jgi:hypothetical protein
MLTPSVDYDSFRGSGASVWSTANRIGSAAEGDISVTARAVDERGHLLQPSRPRVTENDLGAWLLKGNADHTDLIGRFRLDPRIERWCVRPGYRARLMRAGQPVVFWASGSRGRLPYGIWGRGRLTGPAQIGPDGQWSVPLDLRILPATQWVTREQVRADPRLGDVEVLRQPQAGNPSFLSVAQFTALSDHLPG